MRGKRGRGAGGKTSVFGLCKRGGQVDTEIGPDCSEKPLQVIIRGKIDAAALVNTDGWRGHDGLVDAGVDRHFRVRHGRDEFVQGAPHINGTASFWSFAKARLLPFKSVPKHPFLLHLKGSEFRFNLRYEDRYKLLLKLLRQQPLSLGLLPKPLLELINSRLPTHPSDGYDTLNSSVLESLVIVMPQVELSSNCLALPFHKPLNQ